MGFFSHDRRFVRVLAGILCLAVLFFCAACASGEEDAGMLARRVEQMCATEDPLPAGRLFRTGLAPEDPAALTETLLAATLGDGTMPWQVGGIREAAMYLSFAAPERFFCFDCGTVREAEDLAELLAAHLATLKIHFPEEDGCVRVAGHLVLFAFSKHPAAAIAAGR